LSQEELVRLSPLAGSPSRLPLVVEPALPDLDLAAYAAASRGALEELLFRHGALLFRGFGLRTVEAFQKVVDAVSASGALESKERPSPRSKVSGPVSTSTDYPPDQPIFLHNEQSYNWTFPGKILFFCVTAASAGGATPIADCRRVYERIPAPLRERCERLGYLYVRNFGAGLRLSWQEAFQTPHPRALAAYCAQHPIQLGGRDGGRLRPRQVRPAAAAHPRTGERTWFNHLTFFHVSTLVPAVRDAVLASFAEEDLPNNTYYGDGSPIEPEALVELRRIYD